MNDISNDDMLVAIENQDYQKIMAKASRRFFGLLSYDEIESCKLTALWKALSRYDVEAPRRNKKEAPKFTSFLYRGVQLECKTAVKFVIVGKKQQEPIHDNIGVDSAAIDSFEMRDEISRIKHGDVIEELYFNGLTIKELAEKVGVSKQIIAIRKKRALKSLKARLE